MMIWAHDSQKGIPKHIAAEPEPQHDDGPSHPAYRGTSDGHLYWIGSNAWTEKRAAFVNALNEAGNEVDYWSRVRDELEAAVLEMDEAREEQ